MGNPQVHLFLDESGTSPRDKFTLIGATAFLDVEHAERTIKGLHSRLLGEPALWDTDGKRADFQRSGFHFAEDSEAVRDRFLTDLYMMQFRAYVAYAKNDGTRSTTDLLVGMYGTVLKSVLLRYRHCDVTVVFEENSAMTNHYGRIWTTMQEQVRGLQNAQAMIGTKAAPCLAVTDYVLGVTRVHLSESARPFEHGRFKRLGRNYAYQLDYDNDRHLGGRKHPIV